MGLDYAFYVCFEKHKVEEAITALSTLVEEKQAQVIQQSLPWQPASVDDATGTGSGFAGFGPKNGEADDEKLYCLILNVPLTDELRQALQDTDNSDFIEGDHASIGCVYWAISMGRDYGMFGLCAATTGMSMLFAQSITIQQFIIEKMRAVAVMIYLDEESEEHVLLYPKKGRIPSLDNQSKIYDSYQSMPDIYVNYNLKQVYP